MQKQVIAGLLVMMALGYSQIAEVYGDITADATWSADTNYVLTGQTFVKQGVTLTIEAGTNIYGQYGEYDSLNVAPALVIERNAMLIANGTVDNPITFQSELLESDPNFGDGRGLWGGLILCGNAPISVTGGENFVEGLAGVLYGGNDPDDNSGILRYVRVYNGGSVVGADNEINGITLAGVGRGTTIEYCEVVCNADDGFEMFGGTVDLKYCSVVQVKDDAFDTDEGYQGRGQFLFVQRAADSDRAHEMDNKTNGDLDSQPRSHPRFANVTVLGGDSDGDLLRLREGTGGDFRNYILVGSPSADEDGVENDDNGSEVVTQDWSVAQAAGYPNFLYISENILMYSIAEPFKDFDETGESFTENYINTDPGLSFTMGGDGFATYVNVIPTPGGPAFQNVDTVADDGFFVQTDYKGAFGNQNWLAGWSWLDEQGILDGTVSVEDDSRVNLPEAFTLHGNYPNPFNPSTTIQFTLNRAADVQVTIVNLLGEIVMEYSLGQTEPGTQSITWDGLNRQDQAVPSSIYLYRVTADNSSQYGKMTYLK